MRRAYLLFASTFVCTALFACSLTTDFDALSTSSQPSEGGVPDREAPRETAPDACAGLDFSSDPRHCGRCNHPCLGGACTMGTCQPVPIANGIVRPSYVRLDATHAYVVERDGPRVVRVVQSGGALEVLASGQNHLLGLSLGSTYAYFPNSEDRQVRRVPVAGGTVETVATATSNIVEATVDGDDLLWAEYVGADPGGKLHRADLDGKNDRVLAQGYFGVECFARVGEIRFFGENGTSGKSGVYRMPKDGGTVTRISTSAARRLVADATHVYWVRYNEGTVRRVGHDGTGEEAFADAPGAIELGDMTLDATHVYWASYRGKAIFRKAKAGGTVETIAEAVGPVGVAVDDTAIYWSSEDGRIYRRAK